MEVLSVLIIGIIMTLSGIVVFILGQKRGIRNSWLWASFPIFHGFHEFVDFLLENYTLPIFFERLELAFAFISSFALLAASIEFVGVISNPTGKVSAGVGLLSMGYVIFAIPAEELEALNEIVILSSDLFRFFFGFLLVMFAVLAIFGSYLYLVLSKKSDEITKSISQTSIISSILLIIFAIFEGFNSTSPIFIIFRAISLSLFVIIPAYIVLTSKLGLTRLLVMNKDGMLLYGYNFLRMKCLLCNEEGYESDKELLMSSFLAALSGFTSELSEIDKTFNLESNNLYFVLTQRDDIIYVIQSRNYSKQLEVDFFSLTKKIHEEMKTVREYSEEKSKELNEPVLDALNKYL